MNQIRTQTHWEHLHVYTLIEVTMDNLCAHAPQPPCWRMTKTGQDLSIVWLSCACKCTDLETFHCYNINSNRLSSNRFWYFLHFSLTVIVFPVFQTGMPQTVCSGTMFTTPSGFSPHLACAEPGEEEEEAPQEGPGPGACLADGPPITSASLDTLIQNLVPTADYYPEVNDPPTILSLITNLQKCISWINVKALLCYLNYS